MDMRYQANNYNNAMHDVTVANSNQSFYEQQQQQQQPMGEYLPPHSHSMNDYVDHGFPKTMPLVKNELSASFTNIVESLQNIQNIQ